MKKISKLNILSWGVSVQIKNRPSKVAIGMAYTNERRARVKGKSIFYHHIITNNKCSPESRRLAVRGSLDTLNIVNSVSLYNYKRFKNKLPQQKKASNDYFKKLLNLTL
jgi:hypothetical protein